MSDFIMCARSVKDGKFTNEPGKTRFLQVKDDSLPLPEHEIAMKDWYDRVQETAVWKTNEDNGLKRGDVIVFIHGYNNDHKIIMQRHRRLKKDLAAVGYKGQVISFDWPSADYGFNYLEDRHDAKQTAMQLVRDGIYVFSQRQRPDCYINVHLLAHSTGAFVIREAFDDADDSSMPNSSWRVNHIFFIGADLSSSSLSSACSSSDSIYRHCSLLTNYSNIHDSVLKLSNVKRAGIAPRVGKIGLPEDIPVNAVNVDCSDFYNRMETDEQFKKLYQSEEFEGAKFCHSWHIGNSRFASDMLEVIKGNDPRMISTREIVENKLVMKK